MAMGLNTTDINQKTCMKTSGWKLKQSHKGEATASLVPSSCCEKVYELIQVKRKVFTPKTTKKIAPISSKSVTVMLGQHIQSLYMATLTTNKIKSW